MLPFLAAPKRYTQGPIVKRELAYLKSLGQQRPRWWTLSIVTLVIPVILASMLPFYTYLGRGGGSRPILVILAITYTLHFCVTTYTLILASTVIRREEQSDTWDNLVLTGIDVRQILLGKWWAVLHTVWPWYVISALTKLGLAYALAQYFHFIDAGVCYRYVGPLCYQSNFLIVKNPDPLRVVISWLILLTYSLSEAGGMIALGTSTSLLIGQRRISGIILSFLFRTALIVIIVAAWFAFISLNNDLKETKFDYQYAINWQQGVTYKFPEIIAAMNDWQRLLETTQLGMSPLADSGVLIAADLMRPENTTFHFIVTLVTATCGFIAYFALLWATLRLAQFAAIRRGASRPIDT